MSGPQLNVGRSALAGPLHVRSLFGQLFVPLVVPLVLALSSQSSCTAPTPGYCTVNKDCSDAGQICSAAGHFCMQPDAAGDAAPNDGAGGQAAGDAAADAPADGAGGDGDSGVVDGGDAGDGGGAGDGAVDRTVDRTVDTHVGCNGSVDCTADPARTVCEYSSGTCFGCVLNSDCSDGGAPVCDQTARRCVQCVASTNCSDAGAPVCDVTVKQCVQCLTSTNCSGAQARVCDVMAKHCVQCLTSADCSDPTRPICEAKMCRGCKADSECTGIGPEVCMSHIDGHCAIDDETVYVQNDSQVSSHTCSDTAPLAGSRTVPFCASQLGIDAATVSRPPASDAGARPDGGPDADARAAVTKDLVVMRGPDSVANWSFGRRSTLTVVGQRGASIFPGTVDGIALEDGTLYVRDLRITGGRAVGVRATGGELHLDRMILDANRGGLLIDGAAFEITNSVITGSAQATIGSISWSGIFIGTVPATGQAVLRNDTVVENQTGGIVCVGNPRTSEGLLVWHNPNNPMANDPTGNVVGCTLTPCCGGAVDPLLSPGDYHLTMSSPCRSKLAVSMSTPPFDIDRQARPTNLPSDCGADEYIAPTP